MATVGLPGSLEGIGLSGISRDELRRAAEAATREGETIHNEPFTITTEDVLDAMLAADAPARAFPGGISIGEIITERHAA